MANNDIVFTYGTARETLPTATADGNNAPIRAGKYGEQMVATLTGSKMNLLGGEGTYFVATNATYGTAISGKAAPTAFSATNALLSLFNSAAAGGSGKTIWLDYIRLYPKAAGTNGTEFGYAMSTDRINRFTSGGTAITPINANIMSDATSLATLNVGDLTIAAAGAQVRRFSHGKLRTVIKVIGDVYEFRFGDSVGVTTGMPLEGTLQAHVIQRCGPCPIPPGCNFLLHEIAASQSVAATYELEAGWYER